MRLLGTLLWHTHTHTHNMSSSTRASTRTGLLQHTCTTHASPVVKDVPPIMYSTPPAAATAGTNRDGTDVADSTSDHAFVSGASTNNCSESLIRLQSMMTTSPMNTPVS